MFDVVLGDLNFN